jgi:hypothetical protein
LARNHVTVNDDLDGVPAWVIAPAFASALPD